MKKVFKENILIGVFAGILIHGFALVNKWPNWDDLGQLWDKMDRTMSGRWLLSVPASVSSRLSMPWINGLLAILYIVIAANFVISLLDVQKKSVQLGIQVIMLAFPAVGATIFYTNSFDGYAFAILLICLGVWCVGKIESIAGVPLGIVAIIAGMACYQSYVGFGAAVAIIYVIWKLAFGEDSIKNVCIICFRYFVVFLVSAVGYVLISKMLTQNSGLTSYMGIDQMGSIHLNEIPGQLAMAYKAFVGIDIGDGFASSFTNWVCIGSLLLLAYLVWKKKLELKKIGLLVLLIVVFPIGCNLVYLFGADAVHSIMLYGLAGKLIICLVIFDKIAMDFKKIAYCGILGVGIIAWIYTVETNMAYLCAHVAYEETYAYTNRVLLKVELQEGFSANDKVYFIGMPNWDYTKMGVEWMKEPVFSTFTGLPKNLVKWGTYPLFCNKYMGFQQQISNLTAESSEQMGYTDLINTMSIYPNDGSIIRTEEGCILVKFSELK